MFAVGSSSTIEGLFPQLRDVKLVGQGGQRVVYSAHHERFGYVALKFPLHPSYDDRSIREVEICLKHKFPYVPQMFDAGYVSLASGQSLYIIEQFIEGEMLNDRLATEQQLSLRDVLTLLQDLLTTAVELEKVPIVHRDIKPKNIVSGLDGHFWLVDFGIARHLGMASLTETGDPMGPHSAGYAAPEVMLNRKGAISIQADLFSIGVVAYEALSGTHPFGLGSADRGVVRARVASQDVPLLRQIEGDVDDELATFISRLMQRFESRRPKDAATALKWYGEVLAKLNVQR